MSARSRLTGSRPNILFVPADDLSYRDLGCFGQIAMISGARCERPLHQRVGLQIVETTKHAKYAKEELGTFRIT